MLAEGIVSVIREEKLNTLSPTFINQLVSYWLAYGDLVDRFETFGGFETDIWCIGKCSVQPATDIGPMPSWDKFLDRMNDRDSYAAWIYGVASKKYQGRQILWLQGENGEDGKTYNQKFSAKHLFRYVAHAMANGAFSEGASRFLAAEFEGKALAYWDDCNNRMAIFREDVKQLSCGLEGMKRGLNIREWVRIWGNLKPECG